MQIQQRISKVLSTILVAALFITPEVASAVTQQNAAAVPQTQQPANDQAAPSTSQGQQSNQQTGTTIDPSKAPLQPVTTYPEAPTPQQDQQTGSQPAQPTTTTITTTTTQATPQEHRPATEPVGAAAAEKAPTAGGAASKPAGAAIAPAKQHQTRSLLIKIGAIAAGGLAAGTIYALSRGTSSKPPGAGAAGTTQK